MKPITQYIFSFMIIVFVILTASEGSALHEMFNSLDLNRDGKVDRNEFSEDMKKESFDKLDADKNREITETEWGGLDSVTDPEHGALFKRIDKDKDKRITFFEFSDYADRNSNIDEAFMGLDKDGSNNLSPDEITVRPLFKWITIRF